MKKIKKPTLVVDKQKCIQNIEWMNEKAKMNNIVFRPHFKTHQSEEVSPLFKERGISQITVSSVEMAMFFANLGWDDICIAFPLNIREIDDVNDLAKRIKLHLLVESVEVVKFLQQHLLSTVCIWIEIDVGYHRSGISSEKTECLRILSAQINQCERTHLEGILTHSGHTYEAKSMKEVAVIFSDTRHKMLQIKEFLSNDHLKISIGDTPSSSLIENFESIDEMRPGNFVYFDAMQLEIGSCTIDQIAAVVVCPIVSVYPERGEIVIYGGAVHFSKEVVESKKYGPCYGLVVQQEANSWGKLSEGNYLYKLSQEHGVVKANEAFIKSAKPGDLITIIPAHSCLAANLLKKNQMFLEETKS